MEQNTNATCCKHKYGIVTLVLVGALGYYWGRRNKAREILARFKD